MASQRDAKKKQQDFFANMQTVANDLASVTEDLRSAAHMLQQNAQAQPTYGGPNGSRPVFNGDGTHRPQSNRDYSLDQGYAGYGALRRSVASEAAARYGSTGGLFERGNTYAPRYDRNGQIKSYDEVDRQGVVVGTHGRSSTEAQQGYARQQRAQGFAQAANAPSPFFTGAGNGPVHTPGVSTAQHVINSTVGRIPGVGGIIAAGVGALIGAPDAIMNGIVNQRAKNAQYQSILGGTNWSTGTHNRWLEEGFKLSQLYSGGLTGSQSVEAFRSVTGLGYTGDARDKSLGLITSNYKNLGMSVGDSLKFVGLMAQSSSTSFENLKTVLNQVGDSAKSTGQNLELARTNLANLFGIATNAIGGPGALQTSGLVGTYQTQLGRNFANVDFSQMVPGVNPGLTALQASSVGMSMSQYELTQAGGGAGARALQENAGDKLLAMSVAPTVGLVQPIINQLMQKHGGMKAVTASNDSWQSFVQNVMRDPSFIKSGVNIMALKAQIKAYTGATMNDQQAIEWLLRQTTGVGASFKAVDKRQKQSMMQVTGGFHKERLDPTSADYVQYNERNVAGGEAVWERYRKAHHIQVRDGQLYKENAHKDPILDNFKKFANEETHVVVQTKDGPKVVSGTYAMQHMKDQIAKGTAKFIGGQYDGQNIKDVVGGGYGESNYQGTNTTKVSGGDKHHFKTIADYEKHANKTNGSGGKVIIAPNPALAQLLNITATGNVTVANEGARFGAVPKPDQVGPN
jgi:hypothetical protein